MKRITEAVQLLNEKYLEDCTLEENLSFPVFFIDQNDRLGYRFFTYSSGYGAEGKPEIGVKRIAEMNAERGRAEVFMNREWVDYYHSYVQDADIPEKLVAKCIDLDESRELYGRVMEDSETIKTMVFQPIQEMPAMQAAFICQFYYNWMRCMNDKLYQAYWKYGWDFMSWMHLAAELQGMKKETPEPKKERVVTPGPVPVKMAGPDKRRTEETEPENAGAAAQRDSMPRKTAVNADDKKNAKQPENSEDAEVKKLASYLMLCKIIRTADWGETLLSSADACASLAFLVDYYRGTPEFKEIRQKIKMFVEVDDRNELCWMLYRWIKTGLQARLSSGTQEDVAYSNMLESISRDQRSLRKQGKCRMFWIARKKDYPQWYLKYDELKKKAKK